MKQALVASALVSSAVLLGGCGGGSSTPVLKSASGEWELKGSVCQATECHYEYSVGIHYERDHDASGDDTDLVGFGENCLSFIAQAGFTYVSSAANEVTTSSLTGGEASTVTHHHETDFRLNAVETFGATVKTGHALWVWRFHFDTEGDGPNIRLPIQEFRETPGDSPPNCPPNFFEDSADPYGACKSFGGTTTAPPYAGEFCGPFHTNIDGSDVMDGGKNVQESGASLDRCKQMCSEHPSCTAFNWVLDAPWLDSSDAHQFCYLKTGITDSSQLDGYSADYVNIYFKGECSAPAPAPGPTTPTPSTTTTTTTPAVSFCGPYHTNHEGDDVLDSNMQLINVTGIGLDKCKQMCRELPACTAINWVHGADWSPEDNCYPKTRITAESQLNSGWDADWVNIYFKCDDDVQEHAAIFV